MEAVFICLLQYHKLNLDLMYSREVLVLALKAVSDFLNLIYYVIGEMFTIV